MKKILTAAAIAVLLMGSIPAFAAQTTIFIDGNKLDAPTIITAGRTMVPLRQVFTALGAQITWDAASKSVAAQKDDKHIILNFVNNSGTAYIDSIPYKLDAAPKIINGSSFVPLRFVCAALGADVKYDAAAKVVTITSAPPTPVTPVPQPVPAPVADTTDTLLQTVYTSANASLAGYAPDKMPYIRIYNHGDWNANQEVFTIQLDDAARWNIPGEDEKLLHKDRSTSTLNVAKALNATGYIKRTDISTLSVYIRKATAWEMGDYIEIPLNVNFNDAQGTVSLQVISDNTQNNGKYQFATISANVSGISISRKDLTVELNATRKLSAIVYPRGVFDNKSTWTSADVRIASVDANGVVTGVSKGKTLITVSSAVRGYSDHCYVEVIDPFYAVIYDYAMMPDRVAWLKIPTPASNYVGAGHIFQLQLNSPGEWNIANQRDLPLAVKPNKDTPAFAGTQNSGAVAAINALAPDELEVTLQKSGDWTADELWIPLNVRLINPGTTMKITISSTDSFFPNESFNVPVY